MLNLRKKFRLSKKDIGELKKENLELKSELEPFKPSEKSQSEKSKNGKKKAGKQQEKEDLKGDEKPAKRANKGKGGPATVKDEPETAAKNEKPKNVKKKAGKQEKEDPVEQEE